MVAPRPALSPRGVLRPRLIRRFAGSWKAAVLSAPAGYGKSTLAAQLAARHPSLWVRALPEHANPVRLLEAFVEAARHARPPLGRRTALLFASRRDWERDGGLLTASLLDELARAPRLVIVDDLHVLTGAGAALAWLLEVVQASAARVRFLFAGRGEC